MKLKTVSCAGCGGAFPETHEKCPHCGLEQMLWTQCSCGFGSARKRVLCPQCWTFLFGGRPVLALAFFQALLTVACYIGAFHTADGINYGWIGTWVFGSLFNSFMMYGHRRSAREQFRRVRFRKRKAIDERKRARKVESGTRGDQ